MSGLAEVQARVATISSRLQSFSAPRGVDPARAQAFASTLGAAVSTRGAGAGAAVSPAAQALAAQASGGLGLGLGSGLGTPGLGAPGLAGSAPIDLTRLVGATPPPATGTPGGPSGSDVVAAARRYLGVPYLWGGTDPAKGFDCSGLVQRVFADLGVTVPRTVADQRHAGTAVASMADARPGDLLVYDSAGSPSGRHIGIYVGDGQMLNAPSKGKDVRISAVWPDPTAIRRVVPAEGTAAAAAPAGVATATRPAWASGSDLQSVFAAATTRYGLPAGLLAAVAQRESGMRPDAVSPAGARGLMQLMPGTAAELKVDPMDPVQAVHGAARYLRRQLDDFGSLELALAAYNAGPGNVRRYGGIPPFTETRNYVAAITSALGRG